MKAAKKRKPVWGDALVALLLVAAAVWSIFALPKPRGGGVTIHVMRDGDTVWTCALEKTMEPIRYQVEGDYPLMLEVTEDGVRVAETCCPGGDCFHMGMISKAGQQIVCLPNRLVVTLQGGVPAYDAVTG